MNCEYEARGQPIKLPRFLRFLCRFIAVNPPISTAKERRFVYKKCFNTENTAQKRQSNSRIAAIIKGNQAAGTAARFRRKLLKEM
jgi:hypothetical protein